MWLATRCEPAWSRRHVWLATLVWLGHWLMGLAALVWLGHRLMGLAALVRLGHRLMGLAALVRRGHRLLGLVALIWLGHRMPRASWPCGWCLVGSRRIGLGHLVRGYRRIVLC